MSFHAGAKSIVTEAGKWLLGAAVLAGLVVTFAFWVFSVLAKMAHEGSRRRRH